MAPRPLPPRSVLEPASSPPPRLPGGRWWSPWALRSLLGAAAAGVILLGIGLVLAVRPAGTPASAAGTPVAGTPTTSRTTTSASGSGPGRTRTTAPTSRSGPNPARTGPRPGAGPTTPSVTGPQDALATRAMPRVDPGAASPSPVSTRDPGPVIELPAPTGTGPAGVPTGFPPTPLGAMAQLAVIDQTAIQSASLRGVRAVIAAWAAPGGPTTTNWSGVAAMASLLNGVGLSGGGSDQLAVVFTPLMGLVKGTVGPDFVIPCIDFEADVTLVGTARGAVADCERMVWSGARWLIGPGPEPAQPPSVWPDTDTAIDVGYRDLAWTR